MNIILTGASTGIGYELAGVMAREGHKTVVISRQEQKLQLLRDENPAGTVIPVAMDITSYNYNKLLEELSKNQINHVDILVHNAGFLVNKPFEELGAEDWEYTYKVNVIAPALLTRSLLPLIGGKSHTHIVMIGSIGGINGSQKFSGLSAYSSSKGALGILSEMLAEEFKDKNASVNCLALGSVQTEMLEKAFPGYVSGTTPQEISGFIYNFCLTGWKHFNGKILPVSTRNP